MACFGVLGTLFLQLSKIVLTAELHSVYIAYSVCVGML